MDERSLKQLLGRVKSGRVALDEAVRTLKDLPFADLGFATLDTHRTLRQGFPEVVFGGTKTTAHCVKLVEALASRGQSALVTRVQPEKGAALKKAFPRGTWHEVARLFELPSKRRPRGGGHVVAVCAGTSDLPILEEAAVTAEAFGARVDRVVDVGVAGLHRLLKRRALLQQADCVVAVAGMEGALASVVGGLVAAPVVAVPTSIGYGANLAGLTTLLSMMTACTPNVSVVNIDNGFGAGFYAALVARRR
ncbi:MAG: nickel pincer cofactor biosynthesis protein LarB [Myxococcaceae bacterium]|nr:nickel pincer cofactor biosynthesis protein LarB [Myxococcaceae bacterium]